MSAGPYSPCLATTTRGPIPSTSRAACTRLGFDVSWRSSASLRITQSTWEIVLTSESRAMSIHRFIESSATKRASRHCSRTPCCRSGWMLARNRTSLERLASLSLGSKCSKTPSWVSCVTREFRSQPYSPCQKNVLPPATRSTSPVLVPRVCRTRRSSSAKSSPTGPTTRTSSKNDAASAKCVAAPPSIPSRSPNGVDDETALALLIQGLTAWHLYRTAGRVAHGETVVVHSAAGGVGSLAVQLGRAMEAGRVIATAGSEERRALALELGADAAVDGDAEGLAQRLIEANHGEPVDVVFEAAGGRVFEESREALAPFGRLVVYGISTREQNTVKTGGLMRRSQAVV